MAVLVREQVSYGGADRRLGSAGKYDAVALAGDNGSGARGGAAAVWRRQRGRRRARAALRRLGLAAARNEGEAAMSAVRVRPKPRHFD